MTNAQYIQYKTVTAGLKKKADKLRALREAGLPVWLYGKIEG